MRVAVVCWEFGGAQRSRSMAEALSRNGHDVTFITSEPSQAGSPYAVVTIPFVRASVRARSIVGAGSEANVARAAMARGRLAHRAVTLAARAFETLTQFPDKYRAWIPAVRNWLRQHPGELGRMDVVIASTPPASALYVGRMLARETGAALVFDFRDLWTDNPSYPYRGVRRALDRMAERRVMRVPVAAIAATRAFVKTLGTRWPELPARAIYTAIDPSPWIGHPARPADGRLVFGHFGVWYPNKRTIRPLLESLRRLADAGEIDLAAVEIQLWGNGADTETWDAVAELGMQAVVLDCGQLPPEAVPAQLARVDVALLLAWPDDTISVPLKTHGYIASGRQILLIGVNPASEMAAILAGVPGVAFPDSPEALDAVVRDYWQLARKGATPHWSLAERPLPVSQERMAGELLSLLSGLTDPGTS